MPKTALLFPGQGAQAVGMGKGLLERSAKARELFAEASSILGFDLAKLCTEGPEAELHLTNNSQPALFVHSMAALAVFLEDKPECLDSVAAVAGLSLGEYSALCAAGAISFADGVRLVKERGAAMQESASAIASGMASVLGLEESQVAELCDLARQPGEVLQVANLLCPGNIAISGQIASLDAAEQLAPEAGASRFIRLNVAGAFHTDIMKPAVERLAAAIAQTNLQPLRFPLIANVDAGEHRVPSELAGLLTRQMVSPVLWEASLRKLLSLGVDQFYEIGAGRVLAGTLKRIDRKTPCECFGD
ncbi:ACP S-malonyltransferase [Pirellula sp. SH-Sr6A]|uniref:ACP S-malonyltransferase n=1 Tax=Pirellula sp. SH-Sr6A TaxID=1632865 RepID=UPI0011BAB65B|nr:ACP S-malonyltransferase [Pirellula sp. SH-Sr6A]